MGKKYWLFMGFLVSFVVGLVAVIVLSFSSLQSVDSSRQMLTEQYARALALLNDLRFLDARENELALRVVLTGDKKFHGEILSARQKFFTHHELLKQVDPTLETIAIHDQIWSAKKTLIARGDAILQKRMNGGSLDEAHTALEKIGKPLSTAVSKNLDRLFDLEIVRFGKARVQVEKSVQRLYSYLILASGFMFLAFGVILYLARELEKNRRALLDQTEALAQARKEVLETVAHDLKNPLGAIKMSTELLKESDDQEAVEDLIGIMGRSAETMGSLISDLLDNAKIESGQLVIVPKRADYAAFLTRAMKRYELLARDKNIAVVWHAPSTLALAEFDEHRLEQLLSNLMGNAIKFTSAGGRVEVKLESHATELILSVADTGPGLTLEAQAHIFDRYWQVGKTAAMGTGLGLAISKAIADAHHGKLWVKSVVGQGAVFYFSLPCTHNHPHLNGKQSTHSMDMQ